MTKLLSQWVAKLSTATGFAALREAGRRRRVARRLDPLAARIFEAVREYTMTGPERVAALVEAVRGVVRDGVPGAIVECGVWRGGSSMAAALTLLELGETARDLWLYDTFAGMTAPTDADLDAEGAAAEPIFRQHARGDGGNDWCFAAVQEVRANLAATGYPADRMHFVVGPVERTIPARLPGPIALLRLDTDWYESTRHELEHLYPRLEPGGVLILDDYGHWQGARRATDEYLRTLRRPPTLRRIDYTGRIAVKPAA